MRAAVSFTAFTLSVASRSGQLPHACKRRQTGSCVLALILLAVVSGCAGVNVLMLSSETFTPQAGVVEVLERAPARPYVQIAVLTVDSWWLSVDTRRETIVEKAATLGADAVVFGALDLSAPAPGHRTAEQAAPDEGQSSLQDEARNGDVRVHLVRGGGHGGGRGGHHGGFRGGPSGHHGSRHWRHFSPAYGLYGFYGPGWRGYGPFPYWGGYYPYSYYGGYPYADYGYMNSLTVGTAIHYTD
jgi:hypothetical protein